MFLGVGCWLQGQRFVWLWLLSLYLVFGPHKRRGQATSFSRSLLLPGAFLLPFFPSFLPCFCFRMIKTQSSKEEKEDGGRSCDFFVFVSPW